MSWRITARTAKGRTASMTYRASDGFAGQVAMQGGPLYAWGVIDGVAGNDLALRNLTGANYREFRVFALRGTRFAEVLSPRGKGTTWGIGGGSAAMYSYQFSTRKGVRYVAEYSGERVPGKPGPYIGPRQTYAWTKGAWRHVKSEKRVSISVAASERLYGFYGARLTYTDIP